MKTQTDDFCLHCMEWRSKNKDGNCSVCGHAFTTETKETQVIEETKRGYRYYSTDNRKYPETDNYDDQWDW